VGEDSRRNGRLTECASNLKRVGVGMGVFAADREDLIAGFTWKGDEMQDTKHPDLNYAGDDIGAGANQAIYIIRELGDRPDIPKINAWIAHVQYSHLPLQYHLQDRLPAKTIVCPEDRNRLNWQDDPKEKFDDGFWLPLQPEPTFSSKRWPYSSSYQFTISAYDQGQSELGDVPRISQVTTATYGVPSDVKLNGLVMTDVIAPDRKVALHDVWQRHFGPRRPMYGITEARVSMLMFDGSVAVRATSDANPGWEPLQPEDPCPSSFLYSPQDWEPPVIGNTDIGGGSVDYVQGFYRWTRLGLKGLDFGGPEPDTGQGDEPCDK